MCGTNASHNNSVLGMMRFQNGRLRSWIIEWFYFHRLWSLDRENNLSTEAVENPGWLAEHWPSAFQQARGSFWVSPFINDTSLLNSGVLFRFYLKEGSGGCWKDCLKYLRAILDKLHTFFDKCQHLTISKQCLNHEHASKVSLVPI